MKIFIGANIGAFQYDQKPWKNINLRIMKIKINNITENVNQF